MSSGRPRHAAGPGRPPAWLAWLDAAAPRAAWAALALAAALLALWRSGNPDLWAHLAYGRSMLEHGLPRLERWCLAAVGRPAPLEEWLFQVSLFGVYRLGGHPAVGAWRAVWAAAALAGAALLLVRVRADRRSALLLLPLALAVLRPRMDARPEQLAGALSVAYLLVLEARRRGGRVSAGWLLAAQVVWANVHLPSALLGCGLGFLYALPLGPRGPRPAGAPAHPGRGPLSGLLLPVGLVAATFLTPHPLESLRFVFGTLGSGMRSDPVIRAMSELRGWQFPRDAFDPFTAWLAACALGLALGARRVAREAPHLGLAALAGLALGLLALRLQAQAVLLTLAPLALALAPAAPTGREARPGAARAAVGVLACAVGLVALGMQPGMPPGVRPLMDQFPERAAAVADSLGLEGPVLNDPGQGSYLLWARGDAHPPLMDSRALGDAELHADFASAVYGQGGLDRLLRRWNFRHAILPPPRDPADRLAVDLSRRPGWALVCADDAGLLFARLDLDPARVAPRAYRLLTPDYEELARLERRALSDSSFAAALVPELERASRESGTGWWGATYYLVDYRLRRGQGREALDLVLRAARANPDRTGLALLEAAARHQLGDPDGARRALRRATRDPASADQARRMLREP